MEYEFLVRLHIPENWPVYAWAAYFAAGMVLSYAFVRWVCRKEGKPTDTIDQILCGVLWAMVSIIAPVMVFIIVPAYWVGRLLGR